MTPVPIALALLGIGIGAAAPSAALLRTGIALVATGEAVRLWSVRHIGVDSDSRISSASDEPTIAVPPHVSRGAVAPLVRRPYIIPGIACAPTRSLP